MNILFVLYGDFLTNTANPIVLFSRELKKLGHECVITIPSNLDSITSQENNSQINAYLYDEIFKHDGMIFSNRSRADVVHVCTPRIGVSEFTLKYMAQWPTPLVIYLEDNEEWISDHFLEQSKKEQPLLSKSEILSNYPPSLSDPIFYKLFIGLADLVILIQEKLSIEVIFNTPTAVVPWGVDLNTFTPDAKKNLTIEMPTINPQDKVIVYHGGVNGITVSTIMDLCKSIMEINNSGISCKLIRSGVGNINFYDDLGLEARKNIHDIGLIEKSQLPALLGLADIYVQPGRINPFEDLRLPSKLLEFLAMGKPVILPNVNIANQLRPNIDAIILSEGTPNEIAQSCLKILEDPIKMTMLGLNARKFAEKNYDIKKQAKKLISSYEKAIFNFSQLKNHDYWMMTGKPRIKKMLISKLRLLGVEKSEINTFIRNELNIRSKKVDALLKNNFIHLIKSKYRILKHFGLTFYTTIVVRYFRGLINKIRNS